MVPVSDDSVALPAPAPPAGPRAPGAKPWCRRGEHSTSAEVTRGGHEGCERRAQAHTVEPDDVLGLLVAPMHTEEFFGAAAGGPWGVAPRLVYRQDSRHFRRFALSADALPGVLAAARTLHAAEGGAALEHGRDLRLLAGSLDAPAPAPGPGASVTGAEAAAALRARNATVVLHAADMRLLPVASFVEKVRATGRAARRRGGAGGRAGLTSGPARGRGGRWRMRSEFRLQQTWCGRRRARGTAGCGRGGRPRAGRAGAAEMGREGSGRWAAGGARGERTRISSSCSSQVCSYATEKPQVTRS